MRLLVSLMVLDLVCCIETMAVIMSAPINKRLFLALLYLKQNKILSLLVYYVFILILLLNINLI